MVEIGGRVKSDLFIPKHQYVEMDRGFMLHHHRIQIKGSLWLSL